MIKFRTEKTLRKKVEKRYGRPLPDSTWEMLKPDFDESPYDEYTVLHILNGIEDYKPQKRKRKNVVKALLKSTTRTGEPFHPALVHRSKVRYYREYSLGLEKPVPIDKVKTTLKQLGGAIEIGEAGCFVSYPQKLYSINIDTSSSIDVCEVGIVAVSAEWSDKVHFIKMVSAFSIMFNCHPALMVAFILCDILPKSYFEPLIIRESRKISIAVPNPEVSQRTVSKAYSAIKELVIREERDVHGERARPRAQTEKVSKLLTFVDDNSQLGWKDRLKKWNAEYPEWAYDNLDSMQATYYRAR